MPIIDGGTPSGLPTPSYGAGVTAEILQQSRQQLQDPLADQWTDDELISYLNLAILDIITLRPEAYRVTYSLQLVSGAAQGIGTSDIALIDIVANMNGTIRGNAVIALPKEKLDVLMPDWMTETAATTVIYGIADPRFPRKFWVYPPQPATGSSLEVIVAQRPTLIVASSEAFPLDSSYVTAAMLDVVAYALQEETTIPGALAKSQQFKQMFLQQFGVKAAQAPKEKTT